MEMLTQEAHYKQGRAFVGPGIGFYATPMTVDSSLDHPEYLIRGINLLKYTALYPKAKWLKRTLAQLVRELRPNVRAAH